MTGFRAQTPFSRVGGYRTASRRSNGPSQRFPTPRLASLAAAFFFFTGSIGHAGVPVPELKFSLSFGGNGGAPAGGPAPEARAPIAAVNGPPPLPATQKGGGPIPEPFNRMVNMDASGAANPFTRPMEQSVWVMSAILNVAEPISAAPLEFSQMDGAGTKSIFKNPALAAFWEEPVKGMPFDEFMGANVGWNCLAGEDFWILDDTWLLRTVTKSPLILARPGSMRQVIDQQTDELLGWEWMQSNGTRQLLIPDQVIQIKNWNPYNKWRGLSKMAAAQIAAEADYLQGRFAGNLARNNGDQGALICATGQMPTEDQMRQIEMQLRMKREAAQRGELRPVFLAGDIKVEDPKIQTPDADFVAQRIENRHEIYNAFGVPMSMADIAASYSIGSASDLYRLITNTCVPMSNKFTRAIAKVSKLLLRMDGSKPLSARQNFDSHPAMQQARAEKLNSAKILWSQGTPMKVCNDYLGLELPEFEGWDKGYLPINVSPVADAGDVQLSDFSDGAQQTNPDDEDNTKPKPVAEDSVEQLKALFVKRSGIVPAETRAASADARLWKKHMAQRMPSVRLFQSKLKTVLTGARGEMLGKLLAHYGTVGKTIVVREGAGSSFMFNLHEFAAEFRTAMDEASRSAYDEAGQQLFDEIGQDDPWTAPPAKVKRFIEERQNKLSNVPQEIFDQVKRQLQEGIDAGEPIKELSKRVASTFDEINLGRAKNIALTETGAAYGTARQDSMEAAGINYKRWLTSGNSNVRPRARRGRRPGPRDQRTVRRGRRGDRLPWRSRGQPRERHQLSLRFHSRGRRKGGRVIPAKFAEQKRDHCKRSAAVRAATRAHRCRWRRDVSAGS